MMLSPLTVLAALALLPAAASAQETYRIVLKQPARDEPALYRRVERVRVDVVFHEDDKPQHRDERRLDLSYREQILQPPAGPGDRGKLHRRYTRAERIQNGKEEGTTLPYARKTLLIERKDGRYTFRTTEGEYYSGREELDDEFNGRMPQLPSLGMEWLLPRQAVRVGESWKIEPAPFLKVLAKLRELAIHADRATGTGKLVKAYRKDGRRYGVLDLRIEVIPKSITGDNGNATVKLKAGKWTFRLLADGCIDGSSMAYRLKAGMEATLEGTLVMGGRMEAVSLRLQSDVFESRQEAGKE
jgi:hypothetical protein